MADFAASGATHRTNFADRVGREVVLVHVALGFVRGERVQLLGHADAAEGGNAEHLGVTALEEPGAVRARKHTNVDVEFAHLRGLAAVGAHAGLKDLLAHRLLDNGVEGVADLVRLVFLAELLLELFGDRLVGVTAFAGGVGDQFGDAVLQVIRDLRGDLRIVRSGGENLLHRSRDARDLLLEGDDQLVGFLGDGDRFQDQVFGSFFGARFDHHDGVFRAGDDEVQVAGLGLLKRGVDDEFALEARHADAADGAVEGDVADHQGGAGADGDERVRLVLAVRRKRGRDDLDVLAEALGEERSKRAVRLAHGEDAIVARPAFTAGEAAGDLAHGVEALFVVNRQGEEIESLPGVRHTGGDEDDSVAEADGDGAVGLLCKDAVLDGEGLAPDFEFVSPGFVHYLSVSQFFALCPGTHTSVDVQTTRTTVIRPSR